MFMVMVLLEAFLGFWDTDGKYFDRLCGSNRREETERRYKHDRRVHESAVEARRKTISKILPSFEVPR